MTPVAQAQVQGFNSFFRFSSLILLVAVQSASAGELPRPTEHEADAGTYLSPFGCGYMPPDEAYARLREAVTSGKIADPTRRNLPRIPVLPGSRPHGAPPRGLPVVTAADLFLFEDSADVLVSDFSDGQLFDLMAQATNALLAQEGDRFDFVAFFLNFAADHQIGSAFYLGLENDVTGLGQSLFNNRAGYGVAGETLQGWVMMWNQANWASGTSEVADFTQLVLGQEFEHRFGVFLAPMPDGRRFQGGTSGCGRSAHWNWKLDALGSGMEMREWIGSAPAFLNGDCVSFAPDECYNSDIGGVFSFPDLYLMGYVTAAEMDAGASELRYMDATPNCGSPYSGPISAWSSAEMVAANGPRVPGAALAQKHFRTGWIVFHRPNMPPTAQQTNNVVNILNQWTLAWPQGTLGRGTMDNTLFRDCNSNGVTDSADIAAGTSADCSRNAVPDECEPDCNVNGTADSCDIAFGTSQDCGGNEIPNECEPDCNSNGVADDCDVLPPHNCCETEHGAGCNDSGIEACVCAVDMYCCQVDWDGVCAGQVTSLACGTCAAAASADCNLNGTPDECDIAAGTSIDCTTNGLPDECETDCNLNRIRDDCDITAGTSTDCDVNGVPDECQPDCNLNSIADPCDLASGTSLDCNSNGTPDECEVDCNANGRPDPCDIAAGSSADCNANGTPDDCEPDCNTNGVADSCDLSGGASGDCQPNGKPDECDIAAGTSLDCDDNGSPDECELAGQDCNANAIPDGCDLAAGTSGDCDKNGTPDECDIAGSNLIYDCNSNAVPDGCDLATGASDDCDTNGIPDECDLETCYPIWNGFEPVPPFAIGFAIAGLDYNADGSVWDNPTLTATIGNQGCPAAAGKALKIVSQTPPTTDYVASERFLAPNDGAPLQSLTFEARSEATLNPRIDWQLSVRDASNDSSVILIHWASTQSSYSGVTGAQGGNGRGRILVQNPAGTPAFINSGFALPPNTCYTLKATLDNFTGQVRLYINGTLRVTTTRLQVGALRMDYFRLEQKANGQASGGVNRLALDNFELCQTGGALAPSGLIDCDDNNVLDECDLVSGTAVDCNVDGRHDACDPPGDFNGDGQVSFLDFPTFAACFTPVCDTAPCEPPLFADPCCRRADFNPDGDVDLADYAAFQQAG